MIDRYLLRYLLAVVDRGNFSRAAAHCGVSQPTLSVGIAKLEAIVGKTLFVRSNRRVELTGAGARLVERARKIEREFTLAEQETRTAQFKTSFRLGIVSTLPSRWIETAIRKAHAEAPDERVEVIEASERVLLTHLDRGRLDVLLTATRPGREQFTRTLFDEEYRLVMPDDYPLAHRETVDPEDVADSAMIVRRQCEALAETSRYFTAHGVRPFISARTTSDDQALAYVRAGYGLTVMPAGFADHGATLARLSGFHLSRTIGFIHDAPAGEQEPSVALAVMAESLLDANRDVRS